MDASETAEKALYPLIIASQTIPTTALAPLFVLWFGYTIWSKVLVTVLITFFPITITVFDGFKSVKTEMEELLFTFGADKRQIFMKLKVPAVLPCFSQRSRWRFRYRSSERPSVNGWELKADLDISAGG